MSSELPLSFLGNVNIGVRTVREKYPDAELLAVEGQNLNPTVHMNSPSEVNFQKLFFRVGTQASATISTGMVWGEWNPVEYKDEPLLGNEVLPWPIGMDALEADALLKKAGYAGGYKSINLRQPLYPDIDEPYYIFDFDDQSVFVGVIDGKVFVGNSELAEKASEA